MPNKRTNQRKLLRTKVKIGRDEPSSFGHTFNVSPKGIGIITNRLFPRNAKLNCNIYINKSNNKQGVSNQQFISAQGRVVWVKQGFPGQPSKMGIKIVNPNIDLTDIYQSD
jgi:hypothetical protein